MHKSVFNCVPGCHRSRSAALCCAADALIRGRQLPVTSFGRCVNASARTMHNLKRIDRPASNSHLHRGRCSVYQALCEHLCAHLPQPVIIIDWTGAVAQQRIML
ncbi:MAG: hypothetical protein GKR94_24265 [Gammaproteobacteria bacterium]|nr:hypothetical protein [Gammaproteobacteria bacterium]